MKYVTPDGLVYEGQDYESVVAAMAQAKFTTPRTLKTYRLATAKRVAEAYNVTVDPSSNRRFLASLEKAGLLTRAK